MDCAGFRPEPKTLIRIRPDAGGEAPAQLESVVLPPLQSPRFPQAIAMREAESVA